MVDFALQEKILPVKTLIQVLAAAKTAPLGCAFGLSKDKKECLLFVDKRLKPKAAAAKLKTLGSGIVDEGTVRFGRVHIDHENDPETLNFTVNKNEAGGTMMTLVKLAKKTSHPSVVINADPDMEKSSEETEAEGETAVDEAPVVAAPPPPPPPPPPSAPQIDAAALKLRLTDLVKQMIAHLATDPSHKDEMTALAKQAQIMLGTNNLVTATEHADALEALLKAPASPKEPGTIDAAALKARLTGLVKDMIAHLATDPSNKDALTDLAKQAQALLAEGDLAGAAVKADALEALLKAPAHTEATGVPMPGQPGFVNMQKARIIWDAARRKAESEIEKFKAAVEADFVGDDEEDDILDGLDELDEIPEALDTRLLTALDAMLDERTSPEDRAEYLAEAKEVLGEYEAFASSNALFKQLDGATPFGMSFSVASTLTQAIKALRATLH
jgi:hypothetical protein